MKKVWSRPNLRIYRQHVGICLRKGGKPYGIKEKMLATFSKEIFFRLFVGKVVFVQKENSKMLYLL